MRGAKVIVRWFSHEVSDMEFVLGLLEAQDMTDHDVSVGIFPYFRGCHVICV